MHKTKLVTLFFFVSIPWFVISAEGSDLDPFEHQRTLLEQVHSLEGELGEDKKSDEGEERDRKLIEAPSIEVSGAVSLSNPGAVTTCYPGQDQQDKINTAIVQTFGENYRITGSTHPPSLVARSENVPHQTFVLLFDSKANLHQLNYQDKIPINCTLGIEPKIVKDAPYVVVLYGNGDLVSFCRTGLCNYSWQPHLVTSGVDKPEEIETLRAFNDRQILCCSLTDVTLWNKKGVQLWSYNSRAPITKVASTYPLLNKIAILSSAFYKIEWQKNSCKKRFLFRLCEHGEYGTMRGERLEEEPPRFEYVYDQLKLSYETPGHETPDDN